MTDLAPWTNDTVPGSASTAMHLVGVIEIIAVALKPRYGAYLVAAWLGASSSTCSPTRATATSPCATSA